MKSRSPDTFLVKTTLLLVSTLTVMAGATIAPALPAMRQYFSEVANADYWVRLILTAPALYCDRCAHRLEQSSIALGVKVYWLLRFFFMAWRAVLAFAQ